VQVPAPAAIKIQAKPAKSRLNHFRQNEDQQTKDANLLPEPLATTAKKNLRENLSQKEKENRLTKTNENHLSRKTKALEIILRETSEAMWEEQSKEGLKKEVTIRTETSEAKDLNQMVLRKEGVFLIRKKTELSVIKEKALTRAKKKINVQI
jgi:hypothetical protein